MAPVADGHAQQVARAVAGALVHVAQEQRLGIGIGNDHALAGGEHRARHADPDREVREEDDPRRDQQVEDRRFVEQCPMGRQGDPETDIAPIVSP